MSKEINRFFVVCPRCEKKVYNMLGMMEYPEGKFTCNVKCECGHMFQHIIFSSNAYQRERLEMAKKKTKFMTSKSGIKFFKNIVEDVFKGGHDDDDKKIHIFGNKKKEDEDDKQ